MMSKQIANRLGQTLTLQNGTRIGYAEFGRATGRAIIYLHGTPSSRLEAGGWHDLCLELGVRLMVPDRPGLGLSSLLPNRTIAQYPEQVEHLARHLNLAKFDLLGGSGGCPYVLACARFLPPTLLGKIGVIAGSGPPEAGSDGLSVLARLGATMWRFPGVLGWLLKHSEQKHAQDPDPAIYEATVRKHFAHLSPSDRLACEKD